MRNFVYIYLGKNIISNICCWLKFRFWKCGKKIYSSNNTISLWTKLSFLKIDFSGIFIIDELQFRNLVTNSNLRTVLNTHQFKYVVMNKIFETAFWGSKNWKQNFLKQQRYHKILDSWKNMKVALICIRSYILHLNIDTKNAI